MAERTFEQRFALFLEKNPGKTVEEFRTVVQEIRFKKRYENQPPSMRTLPSGTLVSSKGISPEETRTILGEFAYENF